MTKEQHMNRDYIFQMGANLPSPSSLTIRLLSSSVGNKYTGKVRKIFRTLITLLNLTLLGSRVRSHRHSVPVQRKHRRHRAERQRHDRRFFIPRADLQHLLLRH
jgi:hypothetical protein